MVCLRKICINTLHKGDNDDDDDDDDDNNNNNKLHGSLQLPNLRLCLHIPMQQAVILYIYAA